MKEEKKIKSKIVYQRDWFVLCEDEVACERVIATKNVIHHPGACVMIVETSEGILLEKQYRYAIQDFVYELPAGKLNPNETMEDGARRELEEECGLYAKDLQYLGSFYPCFGYSDEIHYAFYTNQVEKTKTHFDDDESIEIQFFSINEIKRMIQNGIIKDEKTISILFKYLLSIE